MIKDLLWGTKRRQGMVETFAKQAARTVGSKVGQTILRGVLGDPGRLAAVRQRPEKTGRAVFFLPAGT